jgi:hypothetical protein
MNVYDRGPGERLVIMDVREALVQSFDAAEWTDLRVGFMLSITSAIANDNISNLSANIVDSGTGIPLTDRFWVGVKDSSDTFPGNPGTQFIGFTKWKGDPGSAHTKGDSKIVSSDGGIATTNSNYWRPVNGDGNSSYMFEVADGTVSRGRASNGSQLHFVQNNSTVYTTCAGFRLTRPDTRSNARQITVQVAKLQGGKASGDLEYTSNPSKIELQAQLANFPTTVQQFGPVSFSDVPDTLFCYLPWTTLRLRIHAAGVYSVT